MLQQMRKFAKSWVSSIFLGLLALSFGVWGIADIFTGNASTTVAEVGGVKIPQATYQREYQNALREEGQRTGKSLSPEQAQAMGLPQDALQRLISRTAVDNVVQRLGLTISDKTVVQQIRQIPGFAGPSGNFDHQTFLSRIQEAGYTEQSFIAAMRDDTAREQLINATKDGLQMPAGYGRALFDYINEARAVTYVMVPQAAAGAIAKPSDATLQAYVKANASRFSTPEYRELTYAAIAPADVMNEVSVTDKQLHNEYELRQDQYQTPEKRDVEQITFPDEKSAAAASAEIAKGKSFEDVAKAHGFKPADIALGEVQKADLGGQRGDAAFALAVGGVSKPVKGTFGWVLLKVTKVVPAVNRTFDKVKDELRKEVLHKLALDKISDIVNAFEDAMGGGATLSQAAKKTGMSVVHVASMDQRGIAADGSKASVPADAQFLKQVFAADVGVAGDPFQLQDGSVYALKVDGVTPPHIKPLDKVRAQAEAEWMQAQQQRALVDKAKALAAQANKDGSLDSVAKTLDTKVETSPGLQRGTTAPPFGDDLLAKIFDAPPGTAVFGKADKGGDYIVARITGVAHPPPMTTSDRRYRAFMDAIAQQIGRDIPVSVAMDARKRQGVTIDQKMVDSVTGAGS